MTITKPQFCFACTSEILGKNRKYCKPCKDAGTLVMYCSRGCQHDHWTQHKCDCASRQSAM